MTKAERTAEQIEKAAARRKLERRIGGLMGIANMVAKEAGRIELYAAKNNAAGFDKGAENKHQAGSLNSAGSQRSSATPGLFACFAKMLC